MRKDLVKIPLSIRGNPRAQIKQPKAERGRGAIVEERSPNVWEKQYFWDLLFDGFHTYNMRGDKVLEYLIHCSRSGAGPEDATREKHMHRNISQDEIVSGRGS